MVASQLPLDARDYGGLVTELYAANEKVHAVHVLNAGFQALPEDPTIQAMLDKAIADAESNVGSQLHDAIVGLGYLTGE